jgi:transposase InsO family protein
VAVAIDCHDREVPAYVASPRPLTGADIRTLMDRTLWARFGEAVLKAPHAIQWLSDNGPQYTATATVLYAHELGLVPITTPAYSPESNGLAEAFVGTFKRDYLGDADLRDAETPRRRTRHSGCGARGNYRAVTLRAAFHTATASTATPHLPQEGDQAVGRYLDTPRKSGWRRRVRAANLNSNLNSPPEQTIGEHSTHG